MVREISDDRKALYYVGLVMVIIGVLVFFLDVHHVSSQFREF